jgi:hypothetical protein
MEGGEAMSEEPQSGDQPEQPLPPPRDPMQPETKSLDPGDGRTMVVPHDIEETLDR